MHLATVYFLRFSRLKKAYKMLLQDALYCTVYRVHNVSVLQYLSLFIYNCLLKVTYLNKCYLKESRATVRSNRRFSTTLSEIALSTTQYRLELPMFYSQSQFCYCKEVLFIVHPQLLLSKYKWMTLFGRNLSSLLSVVTRKMECREMHRL